MWIWPSLCCIALGCMLGICLSFLSIVLLLSTKKDAEDQDPRYENVMHLAYDGDCCKMELAGEAFFTMQTGQVNSDFACQERCLDDAACAYATVWQTYPTVHRGERTVGDLQCDLHMCLKRFAKDKRWRCSKTVGKGGCVLEKDCKNTTDTDKPCCSCEISHGGIAYKYLSCHIKVVAGTIWPFLYILGWSVSVCTCCCGAAMFWLHLELVVRVREHQREKEAVLKGDAAWDFSGDSGGRKRSTRRTRQLETERRVQHEESIGAVEYPKYWQTQHEDKGDFKEMLYVPVEHHASFDELLKVTYHAKCTQDRPCPNGIHSKTQGGCLCVQPGADPGLPVGYRVRRIIRVENSVQYDRYKKKKEDIRRSRASAEVRQFAPPLAGTPIYEEHPELFDKLDTSLNETYAWHGTSVRKSLSIAKEAHQMELAGTGAGTMYGAGIYLAESSTKADEYATTERNGYYNGVYALILCRTCMGKFFYTTERREDAARKTQSGLFDSTLGDRSKSADTFRELCIYDPAQCLTEYVVIYERVHRRDDMAVMEMRIQKPFMMELPVYWQNSHVDPRRDFFDVQYEVSSGTFRFLQSFAASAGGGTWKVRRARRIERAQSWNAYIDCKLALERRFGSQTSHVRGSVLTCKLLTRQTFNTSEASFSLDNLQPTLNEHYLFHGTSRNAAEQIAKEEFCIPTSDARGKHGKRFGEGAYFSEDLAKSLCYAEQTTSGSKHVLLCRVACGHFYHTEQQKEPSAHLAARAAGCNCVLAAPGPREAREVVVLDSSNVYTEYILELRKVDTE